MKLSFRRYVMHFKVPGGTSRGVLHDKETFFILLSSKEGYGIGECGIFRGLSHDDRPDYEAKLEWLSGAFRGHSEWSMDDLREFPSIIFGLEQAMRSMKSSSPFELFPSSFTRGESQIPINGLIWMGSPDYMKEQISRKIEDGFHVLKLKIGALDFDVELEILNLIRKEYRDEHLEIRVDANGAFEPKEALEKLKQLSEYDLHSIEQPIRVNQWDHMADLCDRSPVPIALDEELIGRTDPNERKEMIEAIKPQFLILKPSLVGGFAACDDWIQLCRDHEVGWWITSALESNVGLNAIAQYTFAQNSELPQGLGTGGLFTNNFDSPLHVRNGKLGYDPNKGWPDLRLMFNQERSDL